MWCLSLFESPQDLKAACAAAEATSAELKRELRERDEQLARVEQPHSYESIELRLTVLKGSMLRCHSP
jgi:hypothetical protein